MDFFFLAAVVELAGAEEELACCGLGAIAEAALAARVVVTHTFIASVRSSDATIGSLVIFLRCSSLPGAYVLEQRWVRPGCVLLL